MVPHFRSSKRINSRFNCVAGPGTSCRFWSSKRINSRFNCVAGPGTSFRFRSSKGISSRFHCVAGPRGGLSHRHLASRPDRTAADRQQTPLRLQPRSLCRIWPTIALCRRRCSRSRLDLGLQLSSFGPADGDIEGRNQPSFAVLIRTASWVRPPGLAAGNPQDSAVRKL